jgi:hypothetical protein
MHDRQGRNDTTGCEIHRLALKAELLCFPNIEATPHTALVYRTL